MRTLDSWIKTRMPEAGASNEAVFCLFKACLASLIFHKTWLVENLHAQNPVLTTPYFSEDVPFADHVMTRFPWTKTEDTPVFTGIPADVLYMAKIEELEAKNSHLEARLVEESNRVITTITDHVDKSLDERAVGGEGYGMTKTVLERIDYLIQQYTVIGHSQAQF